VISENFNLSVLSNYEVASQYKGVEQVVNIIQQISEL
jgi:hypothetical protein